MAKARMLHKKISTSQDVNRLPLPARLLFTWMIAHADDEGKMKGDPSFVGVTVVPWLKWSDKNISLYLAQMKDIGLIHYWQYQGEWYIEFPKWNDYQQIRKDRFESSKLPSYQPQKDNHPTTKKQPRDNQNVTQSNVIQSNIKKVNTSEHTGNIPHKEQDAKLFRPTNAAEAAAKNAWSKLEPANNKALFTTYLRAANKGLPYSFFYTFVSEIKQSNSNNPGAVFNSKVEDYLNRKRRL